MQEKKLKKRRHEYAAFRAKWLDILVGSHSNSIESQLDHMVMDAIWFQWMITVRRSVPTPAPLNRHLWDLFLSGYVVRQLMAIRRLVDTYQAGGKQGSLYKLVIQMESARHVFRRDMVVEHPDVIKQTAKRVRLGAKIFPKNTSVSDEVSSDQMLEEAHLRFDRLAGITSAADRSPDDCIQLSVFERLKDALDGEEFKMTTELVDGRLAHADLKAAEGPRNGLTYQGIHRCIEFCLQVANFICWDILGHRLCVVGGEYQHNHLEYLDQPMVPVLSEDDYRATWDKVESDIEGWGQNDKIREYVLSGVNSGVSSKASTEPNTGGTMMKVKDLIKKLQQFDPELDVLCSTEDDPLVAEGECVRILSIEGVEEHSCIVARKEPGVVSFKFESGADARSIIFLDVTGTF